MPFASQGSGNSQYRNLKLNLDVDQDLRTEFLKYLCRVYGNVCMDVLILFVLLE